MTITWYPFYRVETLTPRLMVAVYLSLFVVFLYRSCKEWELKRECCHFSYLKKTVLVNIPFIFVATILPTMSISGSGYPYLFDPLELVSYCSYCIFVSLFSYIPKLLFIGLPIFIIGYRDREELGNWMMYAGACWTIFYFWAVVTIFYPEGFYSLIPSILRINNVITSMFIETSLSLALSTATVFNTLGVTFFAIHSCVHNKRNLDHIAPVALIR